MKKRNEQGTENNEQRRRGIIKNRPNLCAANRQTEGLRFDVSLCEIFASKGNEQMAAKYPNRSGFQCDEK